MSEQSQRITMKLHTSLFFDRQAVQNSHDKAVIDTLNDMGAAIRRVARKSIKYKPVRKRKVTGARRRKRRKSSRNSTPGTPPYRHVTLNVFGVHFIRFDVSKPPARPSVIVGPTSNRVRTKPATEALEYGGTTPVRGMRKRKQTKGVQAAGTRPVKMVRIAARPYMNPALRIVSRDFKKFYKDSLHKRFKGSTPRPYRIREVTTKIDV